MVDPNCLSFWFPRLLKAGVSVPRTEIVRTDIDLSVICDGEAPIGFDGFLDELRAAGERIGPAPWFLRTGHGSGKHDWDRTCYVAESGQLRNHVAALVEWSHSVDMLGLPTGVWAVREFLTLRSSFTAYRSMPVAREFRAFVVGGRLQCLHPYWPERAILLGLPGDAEWESKWREMSRIGADVQWAARRVVQAISPHFVGTGDWSVDICETSDGRWFVTDMAKADRSFHWPMCAFLPDDIAELQP